MLLSLKARIILILSICFTVIFIFLITFNFNKTRNDKTNERIEEARNIKNVLMSTRYVYHQQFINSGIELTDNTLGFLPAHALSNISMHFTKLSESGMNFNNVSDRPRNQNNAADSFELKAMKYFRTNPDKKEQMLLIQDSNGISYYHYTAPIYIESYCLQCHGKKENAPPTIQAKYDSAYDYELGDLRGVMSIKLPRDNIEKAMNNNFFTMAFVLLFSFLASSLLIYLLLNKYFLKHLNTLGAASKQVAEGDFNISLDVIGKDELSSVVDAFNSMTKSLRERDTEQNKLHEEAYRYQHQMQSIMENTRSIIYIKDRLGRYLFVNNVFTETFALSRKEVLGRKDIEIFDTSPLSICTENDAVVFETNSTHEFIEVIIHDGSEHTYLSVKSPLKSSTGDTYGLCGISTDITEQLGAQELLKDRVDELERFNRLAVGRELKMISLKKEVNELLDSQGQPNKYRIEE